MTQKKSALGKGLGALLSNAESDINSGNDATGTPVVTGSVSSIAVSKIETNPFQPRTDFNDDSLNELANSIVQQGIIQPITVRKMGYDKYQIISGERRFRASIIAGLEYIPAFVRVANDQAMLEMAIVENIQRENLNPVEIAISYKRLLDECSLSQEQLSERVGKNRSTISNYIRLLKLPVKIQAAIRDGIITMGHARALINVDDIGMQLRLFDEILGKNLSVRKTESLTQKTSSKNSGDKNEKNKLSPEYRAIQDRLSGFYETKVEVQPSSKGHGKIFIAYYSVDDLNRILDMLEG
jgi:ParB family transcriptional regulator, chromosome partitioning protein